MEKVHAVNGLVSDDDVIKDQPVYEALLHPLEQLWFVLDPGPGRYGDVLSSGLPQGWTASIMILKCMWVGLGSSTLMFLKVMVEPPEPWPCPLIFQTEPPAA